MFFRTKAECEAAALFMGHSNEFLDSLRRSGSSSSSVHLTVGDKYTRINQLARGLPRWLRHGSGWLLWLTEYGIWPSRENQHLLCQLRFSYGERRHYADTPGHEFLAHEAADLQSYLTLVMLFGMGGFLITYGGPGVVFISHDGWMRVTPNEWYEAELRADIETFEAP